MKPNRLVSVQLLFLLSVAVAFAESTNPVAKSVLTNSEVAPWETPEFRRFLATKAKAEQGDASAQYSVGYMYDRGEIVAGNQEEAEKWYHRAFEQFSKTAPKGDMKAQRKLGLMYSEGRGVQKDLGQALKWYRKAAEQGDDSSQFQLGYLYNAKGEERNVAEAVVWYRKAGEKGNVGAAFNLAQIYAAGDGIAKDDVEAAKWYRKAADAGFAAAQAALAFRYLTATGVPRDYKQALELNRKAAEQGDVDGRVGLALCLSSGWGAPADYAQAFRIYRDLALEGDGSSQNNLASMYEGGKGVLQDFVEAYRWYNIAASGDLPSQLQELAAQHRDELATRMTPSQVAEAQRLSRGFKPRKASLGFVPPRPDEIVSQEATDPTATGSGFFITEEGYLISSYHVVKDAVRVRLRTGSGVIDASVAKVDAANDLALLKAVGHFASLPVSASRDVKLGGTVATVGFPNVGLQGFAPKLAKGEVASLSGAGDDARFFQVSVPVQPGNSGGPLVDERGNVVGVVAAKLSARASLASTGVLPENVNYAVKSSYLLSFLESVPEVSAKLKRVNTGERKFDEVVKAAEEAAVLVLVY